MKLQIYNPAYEQPIEGFETIQFSGDVPALFSELDSICCDSEAEFISAPQVFSECAIELNALVQKLTSKIRSGGSVVFGGVELDAFADAVKANEIPEGVLSETVNRCRSMLRVTESSEVISKLCPEFSCSWIVRGINYEFTCTRK